MGSSFLQAVVRGSLAKHSCFPDSLLLSAKRMNCPSSVHQILFPWMRVWLCAGKYPWRKREWKWQGEMYTSGAKDNSPGS